uniref:Uncharacterized protein n=1 Tax=Myoviridae sp. ctBoB21 TaxID=2827287 RepID=A0A8S5R6L0_9CAUD|nr:MAG TPA: hypothetical protein [Myoviridae sp. ctBoB21]
MCRLKNISYVSLNFSLRNLADKLRFQITAA